MKKFIIILMLTLNSIIFCRNLSNKDYMNLADVYLKHLKYDHIDKEDKICFVKNILNLINKLSGIIHNVEQNNNFNLEYDDEYFVIEMSQVVLNLFNLKKVKYLLVPDEIKLLSKNPNKIDLNKIKVTYHFLMAIMERKDQIVSKL